MYSDLNPKHIGLTQFMKPDWQYDFLEILDVAEKYGWDGIDAPPGVFGSVEKAAEMGRLVAAKGMRWGLFPYPCDMYAASDEQFVEGLKTLEVWAERAEAAGITRTYNHIWSGSNVYEYERNFEKHVQRMNQIAKICNDHGIHYGVEFIGQDIERFNFKYDFIRSLPGAIALAKASDYRVGVVFDTIHWYSSGANIDDIYLMCANIDMLVNYHVNDAMAGCADYHQQDCYVRGLPQENGIIDTAMVTRMLNKAGYDGPVMLEPMNPACDKWRSGGLEFAVSDSIQWLKRMFNDGGVTANIRTCPPREGKQ